jgi:hypothetical protein
MGQLVSPETVELLPYLLLVGSIGREQNEIPETRDEKTQSACSLLAGMVKKPTVRLGNDQRGGAPARRSFREEDRANRWKRSERLRKAMKAPESMKTSPVTDALCRKRLRQQKYSNPDHPYRSTPRNASTAYLPSPLLASRPKPEPAGRAQQMRSPVAGPHPGPFCTFLHPRLSGFSPCLQSTSRVQDQQG